MTLVRKVTEQQINAALFDLEKKIDTKEGEKQVNSDWDSTSGVSKILNKPNLAKVATSGSYNDLSDKPYIPGGAPVTSVNGMTGAVVLDATDVGALPDTTHIPDDPVQADWDETDNTKLDYIKNKPTLATVATSGDYNDLNNIPTIPTVIDSVTSGDMNAVTSNAVASALSGKADGSGSIYFAYFTPRQFNNASFLSNYVGGLQPGTLVIFSVGWEEYSSFSFAGSGGYIIKCSGSAQCWGQFRNYGDRKYTYGFHWVDSTSSNRFSGIYSI